MTGAPASSRAWRCHAFGDYHDLVLESVPLAAPAAGEVVVAVRAFAPGFPDMLMVQGLYQLKPPLPFTPCAEFAGEVVACGDDVAHLGVGDRVMGSVRYGAAATHVVAQAAHCLPLPPAFDWAEGAAFHVAYRTAWVGLVVRGGLAAGETVLVHGAGGGVGLAAVDLARHLGARVIAMASSEEKLAVARAHGADHVLAYGDGRFREQVKALTDGRGADVVYDPVGGDVFDESTHCIAPFGRLLVIGFAGGRIPAVKVNHVLIKQYAVVGVRAGEHGRVDPAGGAAVTRALGELAASGAVRPHVCARLPFEALREAYDRIAARAVIGRIVVEV
ncbi:MAG: NADPH:quinone oxidoreductase family protein [Gammaproteobacteria bacterium]|nr:NADPH:quinone oxidoreductase family protein [Gammaproteobacteria bacterium]MCP5202109.1 NADPH:quinone oxidoreductase family protein [Gammaproteobacteria bacterium]